MVVRDKDADADLLRLAAQGVITNSFRRAPTFGLEGVFVFGIPNAGSVSGWNLSDLAWTRH